MKSKDSTELADLQKALSGQCQKSKKVLDRMYNLGLTVGASRKERSANHTERFVNQHQTGTISCWTMRVAAEEN